MVGITLLLGFTALLGEDSSSSLGSEESNAGRNSLGNDYRNAANCADIASANKVLIVL